MVKNPALMKKVFFCMVLLHIGVFSGVFYYDKCCKINLFMLVIKNFPCRDE